tara:strand:+ start:25 stop:1050 length:1026 start_codon:yes stop_codon:yes gene_type:complete
MVKEKYVSVLLIFIVITFISVVYAKLGIAEDSGLEETQVSEVATEGEGLDESQEVETDTIGKRDENIIKDLEFNIDKLEKELLKKDKQTTLLENKLNSFTSYGIEESIFNTKNFLFISIILLIVIIVVIAVVLLKALSWRQSVIDKVVAEGKILQFPHETNHIIKNSQEQISENIQSLANFIAEQIQDTTEKTNQSFEKINNINEQLDIFSKKIGETEKDLVRYKEGYDFSIKKNYISLLIKLSNICKSASESNNTLIAVDELIDDYLESEDIKKYELQINKSIQGQRETRTVTEDTTDNEKAGLVIENIEPGYLKTSSDGEKILKPALVKIFKFVNKENN